MSGSLWLHILLGGNAFAENWAVRLLVQIAAMSAFMKVFGRRPSCTFSHAPRPASENLQGTKPREGLPIGRCRALSYGDQSVDEQQLRSAPRRSERWRWRCSCDVWRLRPAGRV